MVEWQTRYKKTSKPKKKHDENNPENEKRE